MKKISMFMIGAAAIAMVACKGNKTDAAANADSEATTTVETVDESATTDVASDATAGNPVDKYADLVNKSLDLVQKAKDGDAASATEYQNLAQEMATLAQSPEFQEAVKNPDNAKKFQELSQKAAEVAQKMMK